MYFLYTVITATGALVLLPYFAFERLRRGKYLHGLRERLGFLPKSVRALSSAEPSAGPVWIHAVSVGELLAVLPLARKLKERFPARCLVISTTTPTGRAMARERATFADAIFYFPLDWPRPVERAFSAVQPSLVVIVETEIWPNFLRHARRWRIPVVFVNGRISERSFRRYRPFLHLIGGFMQQVLACPDLFLMQSTDDARRVKLLGAPPDRVEVAGNLKYDVAPPQGGALLAWLEAQKREQDRWPVLVAGSVVAEEEEEVLAAFDVVQRRWRHTLLVLAPRKPDRFDAAARIAQERGWRVIRRSSINIRDPLDENADVLLLDSLGELAALYGLADAVFVGGSLVPAGGHNILEPAWFGKPPVFGQSMQNFSQMAVDFVSAEAGIQVHSSRELGQAWMRLLENDADRQNMASAARALVERNQGATDRTLERVSEVLAAADARAARSGRA